MHWLDKIPLSVLIVLAVVLGVAPYPRLPEPHLVEKLKMLFDGTLTRPIDIFDLVLHGALPALLVVKLVRMGRLRRQPPGQQADGED